jgi:hypothetical protein
MLGGAAGAEGISPKGNLLPKNQGNRFRCKAAARNGDSVGNLFNLLKNLLIII